MLKYKAFGEVQMLFLMEENNKSVIKCWLIFGKFGGVVLEILKNAYFTSDLWVLWKNNATAKIERLIYF